MISVLIVEDNTAIAHELVEAFATWGIEAEAVGTFAEYRAALARIEPQILIVDLTLPDGSGVDIIKQVRAESDIGIIVMSGNGDEIERVTCIEMGADEYLVKPCSSREMVARIRQLVYRTRGLRYGEKRDAAETDSAERLSFGGYLLDLQAMMLVDPTGDEVSLTTLEFSLLKALVLNARQVMSREALLESVHSGEWAGSDRNIDNLISRIRKKVVAADGRPLVRTVRGAGYMFTLETKPA